jgi:hypothetical protein
MKTVTYTYRISTSSKPEAAFAYISDLTRHPEWNDHLHVTALTPGEIKVGSEYHSVGKTLYEDRHNDIHVTAYQAPTIFSFVAHDPDFKDITHAFKISPQAGGSLVERTITVHMSPMMAFLWNLILFPFINKRENNRSMGTLRAQLERINKTG